MGRRQELILGKIGLGEIKYLLLLDKIIENNKNGKSRTHARTPENRSWNLAKNPDFAPVSIYSLILSRNFINLLG